MRPLLLLALAVVPLAPRSPHAATQEPEVASKAAKLLDRYRAELGTSEQLAKVVPMRARGKASWIGMPGGGSFVEEFGGFLRVRVASTFPDFGEFHYGTDGKVFYEKTPLAITIRDGWDASEFARRCGRIHHVDWREAYSSARFVGEVELDGRKMNKLELTPRLLFRAAPGVELAETCPPDVWYLDVETGLLTKLEARSVGMDGAPTTIEVKSSDWRRVDGVHHPHRLEVKVSGFVLVLEYEQIEHGVEFPADHFALTPEIEAAAAEHERTAGEKRDDPMRLETLKERHIASIRVQCKASELQRTFAVILPETMQYVRSVGGTIAGPPLVRYHNWGDPHDVEAAMPVVAPVKPKGRVKSETLPAGLAVVTWHVGPYDTLGETHERIQAFIEEQGLERRAAPWEEYWTDPGMEPDASKWRTKVIWPVREVEKEEQEKGDDGR